MSKKQAILLRNVGKLINCRIQLSSPQLIFYKNLLLKMNNTMSSRILLAAGIITLTINASCNNQSKNTVAQSANTTAASGKIAYVNIDSLQEKYIVYKTETDALATEAAKLEADFTQAAQEFQKDAAAFQQKAQTGGFASEAEAKAANQSLSQRQKNLENRRQTDSEQMQAKQMAFGEKYQKIIEEYATTYSKEHNYDYILYHGKASQILYANKSLDITNDFIKGINDFKPTTASESTK